MFKPPQRAPAGLSLPWSVPVPVRKSDFVPLYGKHADCNVEAFLGGISPYGATLRPIDADDLLVCDLQCTPDVSFHGRLGSGRAGVYRNKYLKGVGRTTLA